MVEQKLTDYIKSRLNAGWSTDKIKPDLYKVGWSKKDIEEAFAYINNKPAKPAVPGTPQPAKQNNLNRKKFYAVAAVIVIIIGFATYYFSSNYLLSRAINETPEIITPNVTCGDGVCNGYETYEICPADCTSPPVNTDVKLTVNPQQITVSSGDSPTFQIEISSVSNLYGFQFDLNYDPKFLQFTKATEGTLLKSNDVSTFCIEPKVTVGAIENSVTIACTRLGAAGGISGSGLLESVTFTTVASGTAQVKLTNVKLVDSSAKKINLAS